MKAGRPSGFARNLPRLYRRAGTGGVVELLAARALPELLSYERAVIVATPLAGKRHPELSPRRLRATEPGIEEFHERLAARAEPGAPAFSPDDLRRRFDAGYELWVFHVGGSIAHVRWVIAGRRPFPGGSLPLRSDERSSEAQVTAAEFRGRGLAWAGREHLGAVLVEEGVERMFSAPSGFNRRFLAATLRSEGAVHVATTHLVTLAGNRWLRAVPGSPAQADLLEGRGVKQGRWSAVSSDASLGDE